MMTIKTQNKTTMECTKIRNNLIFLASAELEPDEQAQMFAHLEKCHDCQLIYQKFQSAFSIIEKEKSRKSNPYFSIRLVERLENKSKATNRFTPYPAKQLLQPIFAILLIGIAIYTGILIGGSYSPKNNLTYDNSRSGELQVFADEFYLNDMGIENIESILVNEKNK